MQMRKLVFLVALIGVAYQACAETVWIDTDVSIGSPIREVDDAFAMILAFRSPEVHIAGISTTYGNAPLPATTRSARYIVQNFLEQADLVADDVFAGSESARDLGRRTTASEALASRLQKKKLAYLALGPLTNLATFLQLHPKLAHRIERVIFVGGKAADDSLGFGIDQSFHIHDANVFKDPAAVEVVLRSRVPLFLTPIRTSATLLFDEADLGALQRSGPAGNYLSRYSKIWRWFWTHIAGTNGGPIFDALAVLPVTRPALLGVKGHYAQFDHSRNLVVASSLTNGRRVHYCTTLDPGKSEGVRGRKITARFQRATIER